MIPSIAERRSRVDAADLRGAAPSLRVAQSPSACLFISRPADFLMLGGLSVLLWVPFYALPGRSALLTSFDTVLPAAVITLNLLVNYPHFMASYKLAYTQGRRFIAEHWFQLLFVPVAMAGLLAVAYVNRHASVANSPVVEWINGTLGALGLKTRVGTSPNVASECLGHYVTFMFLTVGWHYSKQVFGCMMVYGKYDRYPFTNVERQVLRYALLSTWWISWLYSNCSDGSFPFFGLTINRLNLPYTWFRVCYAVVGVLFGCTLAVFVRKYRELGRGPSIIMLVPMLALLTWHVPLFIDPQLYALVAFFHSLQYVPFVAKIETSRYRAARQWRPLVRLGGFAVLMAAVGYASFQLIPTRLDRLTQTTADLGFPFFGVAALAFINIHHYFIDNALWRFRNQQVRELLLDQKSEMADSRPVRAGHG